MTAGRLILVVDGDGDGSDGETLLKHADTAMYHAKASGRDNAQFYSASLTDRAMRRLELDSQMRSALERDEFYLVYQPLLDVASSRVHGVEALIRWQPPGRPVVPPIEFIPLAEENGLIRQIGAWVLRTACADAVNWSSGAYPIDIAVNLSPVQFRDPDLLESIKTTLVQTGLAPQRLVLEMTEGALMEDSAATLATLRGLRALGVRIALDDFGTRYVAGLLLQPSGACAADSRTTGTAMGDRCKRKRLNGCTRHRCGVSALPVKRNQVSADTRAADRRPDAVTCTRHVNGNGRREPCRDWPRSDGDGHTTVGHQRLAGDEGRRVAGQKDGGAGEVLWCAPAFHRRAAANPFVTRGVSPKGAVDVGGHVTWRDRIDGDAFCRQFHRHATRQSFQRGLGRDVGGVGAAADAGVHRRDHHDAAPAACHHGAGGLAR